MDFKEFRSKIFTFLSCDRSIAFATYTFLVAGAVAAVCTFFLIDHNRSSFEARLAAVESEKELLQAKTELLQKDLETVRGEKDKLEALLLQDPKSYPALMKQLAQLETQAKECPAGAAKSPSSSSPALPSHIEVVYEEFPKEAKGLSIGQSFTDPTLRVTVGVNTITSDNLADGTISVPGAETKKFTKAPPGKTWPVVIGKKSYKVILSEVSWLRNQFSVTIVED